LKNFGGLSEALFLLCECIVKEGQGKKGIRMGFQKYQAH